MTPAQLKRLSALTGISEDQILARLMELDREVQAQVQVLREAYARHGLALSLTPAAPDWAETMVCAPHDGVPYCMDTHGEQECVEHNVRHRALLIERHHALVKSVYEYCKALGKGDVWVLSGGGAQLQAFFGNAGGYLAILYLSLEDGTVPADEDETATGPVFTLQVNGVRNDILFDNFAIPGIALRTHEEVYSA